MEDYRPADKDDVFAEHTTAEALKEIIFNDLNETERRLIIMYAELMSYTSVGRRLNLNPTTCRWQIMGALNKVRRLYKLKKITGEI